MLAKKSPEYLKDLLKLCQNRVVLNKTSNMEHRNMQRKKLLDVVDSVISSNCGKAFSYQMFCHIQEAHGRQDESSVDGHSAELYEQLTQITRKVDTKLSITEEEIRRLRESLEKSRREHDNVRQEITNAENLRRLDDEKHNEQKEEINRLKEELEKERQEEKKRSRGSWRALRRLMQKRTIICTRTSASL